MHTPHAQWLRFFPELRAIENPALHRLLSNSIHVRVHDGHMLFRDGELCTNYLLMLGGTVRVQKTAKDGRKVTLYRLQTGNVCEITTSCLLANEHYHAEAIAETLAYVVLLPKSIFNEALVTIPEFRDFVYRGVEHGMLHLLNLLEKVIFEPVEQRLAKSLLINKTDSGEIVITHQKIADNIGTAREVVSRSLKKLEKQNVVKIQRGKILILDRVYLQSLSEQSVSR